MKILGPRDTGHGIEGDIAHRYGGRCLTTPHARTANRPEIPGTPGAFDYPLAEVIPWAGGRA